MKKLSLFLFTIFFFIFSSKNAFSNDKIFFLDLEYLINNYNVGKITLSKINKKNEENLLNLKNKEKELRTIENDINTKKNVIDENQLNDEIQSFKVKAKIYNDEKKKIVNNFNKYKKDELNKLFEIINPIIQKFMEENSIEILIDSKYVFMGKTSSDITKSLLEEINKNN